MIYVKWYKNNILVLQQTANNIIDAKNIIQEKKLDFDFVVISNKYIEKDNWNNYYDVEKLIERIEYGSQ